MHANTKAKKQSKRRTMYYPLDNKIRALNWILGLAVVAVFCSIALPSNNDLRHLKVPTVTSVPVYPGFSKTIDTGLKHCAVIYTGNGNSFTPPC